MFSPYIESLDLSCYIWSQYSVGNPTEVTFIGGGVCSFHVVRPNDAIFGLDCCHQAMDEITSRLTSALFAGICRKNGGTCYTLKRGTLVNRKSSGAVKVAKKIIK